jgi:hypothetical protein
MTYHAAGYGCRNRACQVRSWSYEEAGLDLKTGGRLLGPFAHTCGSVVGVSADPPVVGRDCSPMSSNKARGCCCRTPGDHRAPSCSRGLQPGGICACVVQRRPPPGGPGPGFHPGRRVLPAPAAALVLYIPQLDACVRQSSLTKRILQFLRSTYNYY